MDILLLAHDLHKDTVNYRVSLRVFLVSRASSVVKAATKITIFLHVRIIEISKRDPHSRNRDKPSIRNKLYIYIPSFIPETRAPLI